MGQSALAISSSSFDERHVPVVVTQEELPGTTTLVQGPGELEKLHRSVELIRAHLDQAQKVNGIGMPVMVARVLERLDGGGNVPPGLGESAAGALGPVAVVRTGELDLAAQNAAGRLRHAGGPRNAVGGGEHGPAVVVQAEAIVHSSQLEEKAYALCCLEPVANEGIAAAAKRGVELASESQASNLDQRAVTGPCTSRRDPSSGRRRR